MNGQTLQIAVYGKGGIGKSTICANLSAALQASGQKTLQIGCDPKHDSTKLLLNANIPVTALDYIRSTPQVDYKLSDFLFDGYLNVGCMEAGGPTPGVGCAGRGIISAFEMLNSLGIKDNYDAIVYDVLGDVVCGGFAVPIRSEYADLVYIVSSGEFMSIYAANNILRGVAQYDAGRPRVAGIIYNKRNLPGEDERIEAFSQVSGLPICAVFDREDAFAFAEEQRMTIIQMGNPPHLAKQFMDLASHTLGAKRYPAVPVTDEELEERILGTTSPVWAPNQNPGPATSRQTADIEPSPKASPAYKYLSKNMLLNEPLHGCAFNGAATTAIQLTNCKVLAHAPKSCSYISLASITSSGRRGLFERGSILPASISPNFASTDMDESDMVFGSTQKLKDKVASLMLEEPPAIIAISSCPSGIIGDDLTTLPPMSNATTKVVTIEADGNLAGDYLQGMLMAYTSLAKQIIDPAAPIKDKTVNIVFEKVIAKNTKPNFEFVRGLLEEMGIGINCRFLSDTTFESLKNFTSAPLNILAYADYTGLLLKSFFEAEYGSKFLDMPLPVGFHQTKEWIGKVASFFGMPNPAEQICERYEAIYNQQIAELKKTLSGKRMFIITYNSDIDWIIAACNDVGIEILKIALPNFSQDMGYRTKLASNIPIEEHYDRNKRFEDERELAPDIMLSTYVNETRYALVSDTIPMCPDVGFLSALEMLGRWATMMEAKQNTTEPSWRNDAEVFRKVFSGVAFTQASRQ